MRQYTLTYHTIYGDRTDVFVEDSVYNAVKEADRLAKPLAIECRCTLSVVNDGVVEVVSERKRYGVWTRWA